MKKIIKLIVIITILMSSLIVLTACGDTKNEKNNNEENSVSNSTNKTEEETTSSTKFIDDNDSYYFIYNGVKIKAGDEISSITSAGLSIEDTRGAEEVEPDSRKDCEIANSKGTSIFNVTAYSKNNSTVKISDSWIGGVSVDTRGVKRDSKVADMEVYGGIKIGSTIEELKAVFGEPDDSSTDSQYVYESKEVSRYYRFDIKDGKITGITWMNRTL